MDAIWLFAGGPMQKIVAEKIVGRNYKLIITDKDEKCICSKYADEFVQLDTFDVEGNIEAAQRLKAKYDIRAVLTVAADCHFTVANVAKFLNLHGIDPEISNICRLKLKTREALTNAGIPQPQFARAADIGEARYAAKNIGLPVVLKAANNSGSRGFVKIEDLRDLNDTSFEPAMKSGTTGYVIVEKLIWPLKNVMTEQSVETLWYEGKMHWLNWVDRLFRQDFNLFKSLKTGIYENLPWGVELGHINPAVHDYTVQKEVYDLIYKAGLAIGMDSQAGGHIFKADIMLTENGPYILELTPRLSGGWDSSRTTPVRGADFAGGAISLALGEKLDLDLWLRYFQYRNPNLFSSILAIVKSDAKDCIGRRFAEGSDLNRERSVAKAFNNLMDGKYVTEMSGL